MYAFSNYSTNAIK